SEEQGSVRQRRRLSIPSSASAVTSQPGASRAGRGDSPSRGFYNSGDSPPPEGTMAATSTPWIIDVTEANFEELVLRQSMERPVVVDFWSTTCAPCRTLGPMLEKLTNEQRGQVVLAKVNVDECPELASAFQLQVVPTVVAIRDGQPVLQFEGAL